MRNKHLPTILYLLLAFCGLIIPIMHNRLAPEIIDGSRLANGLHPGEFVLFRVLGGFTWLLPVPAFIAFVLSLRFAFFRNMDGVAFISVCMFLCASLYAVNCLFLLFSGAILRGG